MRAARGVARWRRADAPRGGTELGRMMGTDPNLALSMLEGLGRCELGRRAGGMNPHLKGCGVRR